MICLFFIFFVIFWCTGVWLNWLHWVRVTHICVSKLTIIGSDNGLSPGRRQAIIWTNAGILTIRNKLQWNFNRNSYIFIQENAFENGVCEMASIWYRPQWVNMKLHWRYYERDGVLNHRHFDRLLNRLFRHRTENFKDPRYCPLWVESTGDLVVPSQRASNTENISTWWLHHEYIFWYLWCISTNCVVYYSVAATPYEGHGVSNYSGLLVQQLLQVKDKEKRLEFYVI